jgi:hypothetical protein
MGPASSSQGPAPITPTPVRVPFTTSASPDVATVFCEMDVSTTTAMHSAEAETAFIRNMIQQDMKELTVRIGRMNDSLGKLSLDVQSNKSRCR